MRSCASRGSGAAGGSDSEVRVMTITAEGGQDLTAREVRPVSIENLADDGLGAGSSEQQLAIVGKWTRSWPWLGECVHAGPAVEGRALPGSHDSRPHSTPPACKVTNSRIPKARMRFANINPQLTFLLVSRM